KVTPGSTQSARSEMGDGAMSTITRSSTFSSARCTIAGSPKRSSGPPRRKRSALMVPSAAARTMSRTPRPLWTGATPQSRAPPAIADPPLVHIHVGARGVPENLVPARVKAHDDVATLGAVRTHRGDVRQLPGAGLEPEVLAGERAYGTDVRDVPRELVLDHPSV